MDSLCDPGAKRGIVNTVKVSGNLIENPMKQLRICVTLWYIFDIATPLKHLNCLDNFLF